MTRAPASAAALATFPAPVPLTAVASSSRSSAPSTSVHAAQLTTASGAIRASLLATAGASATSSSAWVSAITSWPRSLAAAATALPSIPPPPVTTMRIALDDPDLGVVAHQQPQSARLAVLARDAHAATEQRGLEPR